MSLYVGIDGGGSKTRVCLIDESDTVLATFVTGCANKNSVGNEAAKNNIQEGLKQLQQTEGFSFDKLKTVFAGLAGIASETDNKMAVSWLREWAPEPVKILVKSDAIVGLASGTNGGAEGIILISGTGMICLGLDSNGNQFRAGGWGPLFGDIGSGYWIGTEIMRRVAGAIDRTLPETILTDMLKKYANTDDLVSWAYGVSPFNWKTYADVAPLLFEACEKNDEVALQIASDAANGLFAVIKVVADQLLAVVDKPTTLVLVGGIVERKGTIIQNQIEKLVKERFPTINVAQPAILPEKAAALLARNSV